MIIFPVKAVQWAHGRFYDQIHSVLAGNQLCWSSWVTTDRENKMENQNQNLKKEKEKEKRKVKYRYRLE